MWRLSPLSSFAQVAPDEELLAVIGFQHYTFEVYGYLKPGSLLKEYF